MIHSTVLRKVFDRIIIGGGILGLWAARHALKRGERVVLIEKCRIGAGASGGFLGALMPHMPDNWNAKKQLQFNGLTSIADAIADLEADTGFDCGYRQCGRVMPIVHAQLKGQVQRRLAGARENWGNQGCMEFEKAESFVHWLDPEIAGYGIQHDTLSARVNPLAYLKALESYVRLRAQIMEGEAVASLVPRKIGKDAAVVLASGEYIFAHRIVVANGWEAYPLLQPFLGALNDDKPIGRGVKGQALLVEFYHDDDLPIVYHDGIYVVPHATNRVAIGSTSHNHWSGKADAFDPDDMAFYEKAVALVPSLKGAPILERWAGVRPRNTIQGRGTAPWFGPLPEHEELIALIGGFKITFGVGHMDLSV